MFCDPGKVAAVRSGVRGKGIQPHAIVADPRHYQSMAERHSRFGGFGKCFFEPGLSAARRLSAKSIYIICCTVDIFR